MGLMDKVKEQAGQLAEKAQHGVAEGKDKIEELKAQRQGEKLLRELGTAYYALQRSGGPQAAVDAAIAAMDAHIAEHGEPGPTIDVTDA